MTGWEVLREELNLPDEWQLGGGGAALWAPCSVAAVDRPGFIDPGSFGPHALDPVFAVTLLDREGNQLQTVATERSWNPARLELKYRLPQALLLERRAVLESNVFVSRLSLSHGAGGNRRYWFVLWTRRRSGGPDQQVSEIEANARGISFHETRGGGAAGGFAVALGASFDAENWSVDVAPVTGAPQPASWETSPFLDLMMPGGLPGNSQAASSRDGFVYFALAYPIEVAPGQRFEVTFAAALAAESEHARELLGRTIALPNPIQTSEQNWADWFDEVPSFTCSDPLLQRAYWYRWACLRLAGAESPATGREPGGLAALTAAGTIVDRSWRYATEEVASYLDVLLAAEVGRLGEMPLAHVARKLLSVHHDGELKAALAERIAALDPEPRIPLARPPEPWRRESPTEKVHALDQAVYQLDMLRFLAWADPASGVEWSRRAAELADLLLARFWDAHAGFSMTVVPTRVGTGRAKTIHGFLPLLVDLVDANDRERVLEHAFDPSEFWTNYPLPSLSRDDATFNPDGQWGNERVDRPFHGRVWPPLTSLAIDALGRAIHAAAASRRAALGELVQRHVLAGFTGEGADRPGIYEHYNPLTGRPARFLGRRLADGGWPIDHLIRFIVGLRPDESGRLFVDPLPTRLDWFVLEGVFVGDHEIDVHWDSRSGLSVRMGDGRVEHAPVGHSLSILLPDPWDQPRPVSRILSERS